ncbi:hypothetical protein RhiLY_11303 [Ceratobasidium sp. AG-Ba]|nr:hypothetical protein RhiLY_11303 [Ceratobasidium sp. AG-Ba]
MDNSSTFGLPLSTKDKLSIQHPVFGSDQDAPLSPILVLAKFLGSLAALGFNPPTVQEIFEALDYDYKILGLDEIIEGGKELITLLEHSVFSRMIWAAQSRLRNQHYSLNYLEEATIGAWTAPYVGKTAQVLKSNLNRMNVWCGSAPYANYVPITQSSGTGKSRAVDELAKEVFTIPFCLRRGHGNQGYPAADGDVSDSLTYGDNIDAVRRHQCMFFGQLFKVVHDELAEMPDYNSQAALAKAFRDRLQGGNYRAELYKRVCNKVCLLTFVECR